MQIQMIYESAGRRSTASMLLFILFVKKTYQNTQAYRYPKGSDWNNKATRTDSTGKIYNNISTNSLTFRTGQFYY